MNSNTNPPDVSLRTYTGNGTNGRDDIVDLEKIGHCYSNKMNIIETSRTHPAMGFVNIILLEDVGRYETNDKTDEWKRNCETTKLTKVEFDITTLLFDAGDGRFLFAAILQRHFYPEINSNWPPFFKND